MAQEVYQLKSLCPFLNYNKTLLSGFYEYIYFWEKNNRIFNISISLRRVIDIFDDDGNGEVDFKEFIQVIIFVINLKNQTLCIILLKLKFIKK